MAQLILGTKQQIQFASDSEFFEALGFLSKSITLTRPFTCL